MAELRARLGVSQPTFSRLVGRLWQAVVDESDISASFRRVARDNRGRVEAYREVARRLPS